MENFDPQHRHHSKVPWPNNLQPLSIWLPSFIVELLAHNIPPSSEEIGQISHFHNAIQRETTENGEKIRGLRQQIKQLKKEQHLLAKKVFVCEVVSSPFRRLPMDILQQIATHHETPSIFQSGSLLSPTSHLPLLLAQVSHSWRHTIHGMSPLWQNLRFPLCSWDGSSDIVIDEVEHFGRLSGRLPLSIQLQDVDVEGSLDNSLTRPAVLPRILSSWSERHRLTRLTLCSPQLPALVRYLRDQLYGSVDPISSLKSFLLLDTNREAFPIENDCDGELITQLWQTMPDLRHVWLDLRGVVLGVEELRKRSILSDTPWLKLSTLYIRAPFQPREWTTFIKACAGLESAWFWISGPNQSLSNPFLHLPTSPHPHRRLRELIIHFCEYSTHILTPFAGIQFTNLITLQVNFSNCKLKTPRVASDTDLVLPFPSLKNLIILRASALSKNIRGLFPLFLATPSATSLSISFFHQYIVDFVDFLRGMNAGVLPLPKLEAIKLWISAETGCPGGEHEPWPKDMDRILTFSLLETWDARHLDVNGNNFTSQEGLKSMVVEFHTWSRSSDEGLFEGHGMSALQNGERHVGWGGSQLGMIASFSYVRRKVARRGSGIEVRMLQGTETKSFGAPMEERLKNRFEL